MTTLRPQDQERYEILQLDYQDSLKAVKFAEEEIENAKKNLVQAQSWVERDSKDLESFKKEHNLK